MTEAVAETDQQKLAEATRLEDEENLKKAEENYEDNLTRHQETLKDLGDQIVQTSTAIEDATNIWGDHSKLAERLNSFGFGTTLERVKFEKKTEDVDKTMGSYIGALKQVKKILEQRLDYVHLNPPEPPVGDEPPVQEGD